MILHFVTERLELLIFVQFPLDYRGNTSKLSQSSNVLSISIFLKNTKYVVF